MKLSPRGRVGYLIIVAFMAFFIRDPRPLLALAACQVLLWGMSGLSWAELGILLRKIFPFVVMMVAVFSVFPPQPAAPAGALEWGKLRIAFHPAGALHGAVMALRIFCVIAASGWVQRAGRPGDFVRGLRGWMLPASAAAAIDVTLVLLGGGKDRGRGRGGGRGKGGGGVEFGRLLRGDFSFLPAKIEAAIAAAQDAAREVPAKHRDDVAVIAGICLLMLGTKLLKVLPGVPFAPGYKIAFLLPLYFLAAERTHTRWGATLAGTTLGIVSFLFGDGRYGVFEILKHVAPGLVIDAAAPLLPFVRKSVAALVLLSALAATARLATVLAVVRFIDGNAALYALTAGQGIPQVVFGAAGGFVAAYLLGRGHGKG